MTGSRRFVLRKSVMRGVNGWWVIAGLVLASAFANAQTPTPAGAPTPDAKLTRADLTRPMGPPDPFNRGTPRGSLYGYITACNDGDYERAVRFMDVRHLSPEDRERAPEIARKLKASLNSQLWVDFSELSDQNAGFPDDGLKPWQDQVGDLMSHEGAVPFLMQRVPRTVDGVRIWKIAASTVGSADVLYEQMGPGWLEERLPRFFFEWTALGLLLWQWLGLLVVTLVSGLLSLLAAGMLLIVLRWFLRRGDATLEPRIAEIIRGPIRLALTVVVFGFWKRDLALPVPVVELLTGIGHLLFVVATTWMFFRWIDYAALQVRSHATARERGGLLPVIRPLRAFAKVVVVAFGTLAVLATVGVNVTSLIAGLGVGGIAFALAAQKTLENLFGGVTLFADRPVRVGDYFKSGGIEGTIEEIGLRSTRIRTLARSIVTIPNADFSNMALENLSQRDRIWVSTKIGLRYETTTDQLRYVLVRLREILVAHPAVADEPQRVRFVGLGAYSFDLEVHAYLETRSYDEFLAVREDLYLRFVDAVRESGSDFAFPSSTMYVGQDSGLNEADSSAAVKRVGEWRASGSLPFPEFSTDARQKLHNTLEWPPKQGPDDD